MLAMLVLAMPVTQAYALTPQEGFYVNDYAGALNSQNAQYLRQRGAELWQENGVQVVLVIVNNFIGESMDSYANQVFNEFGIGSEKDNNGVLLIVAIDDDDVEVRIEVGDGLGGQIPDSKAGAILEECFMPAASEGNLEAAIYDTYLRLIQEGSRVDTEGPVQGAGGLERILWAVAGLVLILLGVLIIIGARYSSRRRLGDLGEPGSRRPPAGTPPFTRGPGPDATNEPSNRRNAPGGGFYIGPLIIRGQPRSSGAGGSAPASGAGRNVSADRPSRPEPRSAGGGGRSSGGGAGRGLFSGGFGRSSGSFGKSGGFGGGGRSLGGGGRSLGGGAGRSFKK
jgi:uncharacterized protein